MKEKTLVEIFTAATEGMPPKKPVHIEAGQLRELCLLAAKVSQPTTSTAPKPEGK